MNWVIDAIAALKSLSSQIMDCERNEHYCGKKTSCEEESENFSRQLALVLIKKSLPDLLEEVQKNSGSLAPSGQPAVQEAIAALKKILPPNNGDNEDLRKGADELARVLCLAVPVTS